MNANQARQIAEENQIPLDKALECIESCAKRGETSTVLMNLGDAVKTELMRLGFKISIHKDPIMGVENHLINW